MSTAPPPRVALLSGVRSPIGKYGGALRDTPAVTLGALAAGAAVERSGIPPADIEELIFGNGIQAGNGQNPARQVLRAVGVPDTAGAFTVNMVCGSGLQAILSATAAIRSGEFGVMVAGGMESMSSAPYLLPARARWGLAPGPQSIDDAMLRDSLLDAYGEHEHMGLTGERIGRDLGLTREEADRFALRSHRRAAEASRSGVFASEIVAVPASATPRGGGLAIDEGPRGSSTPEGLARLRPAFVKDGLLTAGNSSQISDGAAAVVLASEEVVRRRDLRPVAWVHSGQVSGVPPERVMESPIPTVRRHLERTGFTPKDFDRVEHNEAFSTASIAVQRAFGFTEEQFNVHGGAVALGHPIGASGCRIVVTLSHELVRANGRLGLATLCMGGGNGLSLILDRRGL